MADMRAGGSTETQPRTSSSHTCTSHCTPSRRRLTRYRRTGAGGTAGEAIVASDNNRLSGGAGVAATADDVAVRHNQRPARRRCETTTRQSAATQVAQGTRDMAAISRWSGPMRHAKGGAQDGRARHIDFKEYGGWLAAVLGCPTRDLRELGRVCDIGEPYELRESGRREGGGQRKGRRTTGRRKGNNSGRRQRRPSPARSAQPI